VPRLWTRTIETHRREVRDAIMDATAELAARRGPLAVTMSEIAERTGVGRATLYKYFPDVNSILLAWHERHVRAHLEKLAVLAHQSGTPLDRLARVLEAYALIQHRRQASELAAFLHRDEHVGPAEKHLRELVQGLLAEGVEAGEVRSDVPADELASYCLHALAAARGLPSAGAARRLVAVTLAGLRSPRAPD
jgi:AcrR family transcriptional regulator